MLSFADYKLHTRHNLYEQLVNPVRAWHMPTCNILGVALRRADLRIAVCNTNVVAILRFAHFFRFRAIPPSCTRTSADFVQKPAFNARTSLHFVHCLCKNAWKEKKCALLIRRSARERGKCAFMTMSSCQKKEGLHIPYN